MLINGKPVRDEQGALMRMLMESKMREFKDREDLFLEWLLGLRDFVDREIQLRQDNQQEEPDEQPNP